jgi:hypothetical protein
MRPLSNMCASGTDEVARTTSRSSGKARPRPAPSAERKRSMDLVVCLNCSTRVILMESGVCPACRRAVADSTALVDPETAGVSSPPAMRTNDDAESASKADGSPDPFNIETRSSARRARGVGPRPDPTRRRPGMSNGASEPVDGLPPRSRLMAVYGLVLMWLAGIRAILSITNLIIYINYILYYYEICNIYDKILLNIIIYVESRSDAVAEAPFPLPAHRTGRAVFRHPALGQELMLSPTESSWGGRSSRPGPARRAGTDRGTVTSRDSSACAFPGATDGAGAAHGGRWPGTRR